MPINEIPRSDAVVLLAMHSHIPIPSNVRPEFVSLVLEQLQGRDVTVTFSMSRAYFERAVNALRLDRIAQSYGAKVVPITSLVSERIRLPPIEGRTYHTKVIPQVFDESILKVVIAVPTTHNYAILFSTTPALAINVMDPKDHPAIQQSFKYYHVSVAYLAGLVRNQLCLVDGKYAIEGDGPLKGYQRYWGATLVGTPCAYVDIFVARGLGFDPNDVGYIYFYFQGNIPEVEMPEQLKRISTQIKPPSNIGLQLLWKREAI